MSFRFMRNFIFFDLPRDSASERRDATVFVKNLIKNGYIMVQESVYCKLIINANYIDSEKEKIRKLKPKRGNILMLTITEKQFNDIEILLGETPQKIVKSADRAVFL